MTGEILGQATFSGNNFRMSLSRAWAEGPPALVCMCNPSKAGAEDNDPTILRCNELFRALGYPGYTAVNWSPLIATDPKDLARWLWNCPATFRKAISMENLELARELSEAASVRVVAWGNLVTDAPEPYTKALLAALSLDGRHPLQCFGLTKEGRPKHPMARGKHRIVAGAPLVEWKPAHG